MLKKFLLQSFILVAFFLISSCEHSHHTEEMWENTYKDTVAQMFITSDGRNIAFMGEKYHYIFSDYDQVLREMLNLDNQKLIEINSELTELSLDEANNIEGYIAFESLDLEFTQEQFAMLSRFGFKKYEEDDTLLVKIPVRGKRYLPRKDSNQYFSLLRDKYEFKIHNHTTSSRIAEEIALTPITIAEDTFFFLGEVALVPFRE